ncbi:MAG TPA: tetratricopeptide repeat protein [Candidatus Binatus sp.]|nr:tetratricopeptide repeat protein [Candidatus Binatus sp.]
MRPSLPGQRFANLVARCDEEHVDLPLDTSCLLAAAVFDTGVEPDRYMRKLDALAARAAKAAGGSNDPYARMGGVLKTLFGEGGFRGNHGAYYEPGNSLLSSVLDRRIGIPITLSVVVLETARRVGLTLQGVGLPGHFVVAFPDPSSRLFIDPYQGGAVLDVTDCVALVDKLYRGRITWRDSFLDPVSHRTIVKRVLLNLKNSLSQAKNYVSALAAIELQLVLDPDDPTELRDRGILFARLHRYDRAIEDLETYLRRSPGAGDGETIRHTVEYLRQARGL